MGNSNLKARIAPDVVRVSCLLLLLLYFVGSSNVKILHSFIHVHDISTTHSDQEELDPCHRLIYHHDVEQGCGHDSHLIPNEKCAMCDSVFLGAQVSLKTIHADLEISFHEEHHSLYKFDIDSYWAVISSSRAPPVSI